ncbi:MAG: hypothetical protein C0405_10895 [Desulfovibrio sp.]|nr:hypothetical protein [Desulfovibrio sp.]
MQMLNLAARSLENIRFTRAELPWFTFRNCRWPLRLGLEAHGDGKAANLLECEELYRAMKQRAAGEHDQPLVSVWHFREKLMGLNGLLLPANANVLVDAFEDHSLCNRTRLQAWRELFRSLPWRLRRSLLFLYWTSSGFGERPRRGAVCLVALAAAALMVFLGLKIGETWPGWQASWRPDFGKILEALVEWLRCMPLVKLDYQPNPDVPHIGPLRFVLSWFFQVLITLQAAFFALAVRNRFRR